MNENNQYEDDVTGINISLLFIGLIILMLVLILGGIALDILVS